MPKMVTHLVYVSTYPYAGYTDIRADIDLNSFRRIPWENNIPYFFVRTTCSDAKPSSSFRIARL